MLRGALKSGKYISLRFKTHSLEVQILPRLQQPLSDWLCKYHVKKLGAALGSDPKHTIYAFIDLNLNCDMLKKTKINRKEAGIGPFLKNM